MECSEALHHNKAKTNYHIHLVFSERKYLENPQIKVVSRNMFYDENGKHVRNRKKILDENENHQSLYERRVSEAFGVSARRGVSKSGKNNPKATEIKADNAVRTERNRTVDVTLVGGAKEEKILAIKKSEIVEKSSVL